MNYSRPELRDSAPLWAAAHLPREGGDHPASATRLISPLAGEVGGSPEGGNIESHPSPDDQRRAYAAAAAVLDPEVPCVTVADLGILRSVEIIDGVAIAKVTPTYSGCPAVLAIELAVEAALLDAGFQVRVERVISPAWTTDWITGEGREKLRVYGIAPPVNGSNSIRSLFGETVVACPQCGSSETERVSEFGSTACKALYRCTACREPFDYFKCI